MIEHHFSLVPFPDLALPEINISGRIAREQGKLAIHYSLTGSSEEILFPTEASRPGRMDELWKATCFEFFLALQGQPQYWEFNLSPSGHWNVYRMDAYRRAGFRQEKLIDDVSFEIRRLEGCCAITASVDLSPIIKSDDPVQAGIASIIQTRDGHESYWALAHPNPHADFHSRESFILRL